MMEGQNEKFVMYRISVERRALTYTLAFVCMVLTLGGINTIIININTMTDVNLRISLFFLILFVFGDIWLLLYALRIKILISQNKLIIQSKLRKKVIAITDILRTG